MADKPKKQTFSQRFKQNFAANRQAPSRTHRIRDRSISGIGKGREYMQKGREYGRTITKYTKGDGMKNMGRNMKGQMGDLTQRVQGNNPMAHKHGIRNQ